MTDAPGKRDPLHMDEKEGAARTRREVVGGVVIFAVESANVYPRQADEIADTVTREIETAEPPRLLLDLSAVEFVCSAFLGRLIQMHQRAKERSGGFKVCVASPHVDFTAKLLHLNEVMEIGHDRDELVRALAE
jgi:anti-anti-sigma factor